MFKLIVIFKLSGMFKLSKIFKISKIFKHFSGFYSLHCLIYNLVICFLSEECRHPLYVARSCTDNLLLLLLLILLLLSHSCLCVCSYCILSHFAYLVIDLHTLCTLCLIRDISQKIALVLISAQKINFVEQCTTDW